MRDQFFLDARDYLKYALLEDLAKGPPLRRLVCFWMLRPDQANTHGSRLPQIEPGRPSLNEFFARSPRPRLPDVRDYFCAQGISCASYGDSPNLYFDRRRHPTYFQALPDRSLQQAIVFLDPDNGLAPTKSCSNGHVMYDEVLSLFCRMGEDSALVIYQHLPRESPVTFWPKIAERLQARVGCDPYWVPLGVVAFYLLFGGEQVRDHALRALRPRFPVQSLASF